MIDPIHVESFAEDNQRADELAYLVVPSAIGEVAVEAAGV